MKKIRTLILCFYASLIVERLLVHFPRASMNMDSLYYTLSAVRFAEGNFAETFSGPWQPLMGWLAGVLVFFGVPALWAVNWLCVLGGLVALWLTVKLCAHWGWRAALVAGFGLASEPHFLAEVAAVRSDGLHVGISFGMFYLFARAFLEERDAKTPLSFYALMAVLASGLVALRVAALPTVLFVTFLVSIRPLATPRVRFLGLLLFYGAVGGVIALFCLYYYRRFGLFIPSLNFALNRFLMAVEWMRVDVESFCRLYDGKNTFLSDLQFLDPSVHTLPAVPFVSAERVLQYRWNNFIRFFPVAFRSVNSVVWIGVAFGLWTLWKDKRYRLMVFGFFWTGFACGAQMLSTIQTRFFLPWMPILYWLCAIGVARVLPKRAQWIAVGIVALNLWAARADINPGFLLSGTFMNAPDLVGDVVYQRYGPGRVIMAVGHYPSLIAARARWKAIPCIDTPGIEAYMKEKKVEFVMMQKPIERHFGESVTALVTRKDSLLELEHETDAEVLYRVIW